MTLLRIAFVVLLLVLVAEHWRAGQLESLLAESISHTQAALAGWKRCILLYDAGYRL